MMTRKMCVNEAFKTACHEASGESPRQRRSSGIPCAQFLVAALRRRMGDWRVPLALAVVLFAWGSIIMFRVERDRCRGMAVAPVPEPIPVAPPTA